MLVVHVILGLVKLPPAVTLIFCELCKTSAPEVEFKFPVTSHTVPETRGVVVTEDADVAEVALEHVPKMSWVNVFWPVMVWAVSVVTAFAAMLPFAREIIEP